jgi:hypothetical protein
MSAKAGGIQDRLKSISAAFQHFESGGSKANSGGARSSGGKSSGVRSSGGSRGGGRESRVDDEMSGDEELDDDELDQEDDEGSESEESTGSPKQGQLQKAPKASLDHPLAPATPPENGGPETSGAPGKKKSVWKIVVVVFIVIALLVIFGLILIRHYKKRKEKKKPEDEETKKWLAKHGQSRYKPELQSDADFFRKIDDAAAQVHKPRVALQPVAKTADLTTSEAERPEAESSAGIGASDTDLVPL